MKRYIALFDGNPYSDSTKGGFKRISDAEDYIAALNKRTDGKRAAWLVIDSDALHRHLNVWEEHLLVQS